MSLSFAGVPFAYIASGLVQRVATALGITIDFVRPVASDNYKVTETENLFAYLRFYEPSPVDPSTGQGFGDYGAGRHSKIVGRRLRSYIYTRSGVDSYGGDEIALMGASATQTVETPPTMPGQFVAEELVLNALLDYTPASGTISLTVSPLQWLPAGGGPAERKPEDEEGLVRSSLDFQIVYCLAITNEEPAPTSLPVPNQE